VPLHLCSLGAHIDVEIQKRGGNLVAPRTRQYLAVLRAGIRRSLWSLRSYDLSGNVLMLSVLPLLKIISGANTAMWLNICNAIWFHPIRGFSWYFNYFELDAINVITQLQDVAEGVCYLHERSPRVVHGVLKPVSSILRHINNIKTS
jgi:hypothetical protein